MQVTLFANVLPQFNPYIALLRQAVQPHCEAIVTVRPRFTPDWVYRYGKAGSIAHIHWIESHINPRHWFEPDASGYRYLINRLGNNRLSHPARATGLLVKLAVALALARRTGVPVVYTVHNLTAHHHNNSYYAYLERLANRLIFVWANAVHVHSHETVQAIARSYGRTRNVFVAPHGNYIGWYSNTVTRAEARLHLSLPGDTFVYLSLGQIAPYKGLEELVEAFVALGDPAARLIIAGKVAHADYSARMATITQHPHILYLPDFVPDHKIQIYFNAADIVVLPYQRITTSGSALLAFSFGRPVIAPALGALSEFVPSPVGLLYPPHERGALTSALCRAQSISWSSQVILAHARQFDWHTIGSQIANIYRTVLLTPEAAVSSRKEHV